MSRLLWTITMIHWMIQILLGAGKLFAHFLKNTYSPISWNVLQSTFIDSAISACERKVHVLFFPFCAILNRHCSLALLSSRQLAYHFVELLKAFSSVDHPYKLKVQIIPRYWALRLQPLRCNSSMPLTGTILSCFNQTDFDLFNRWLPISQKIFFNCLTTVLQTSWADWKVEMVYNDHEVGM